MLTKQERAAIAARVASYDGGILTWNRLYECLLDAPITGDVSIEEDSKYVIDRIIELCDTSNMMELPLDKDGEVIHIGDTVYDDEATEYKAVGYSTHSAGTNIIVEYGKNFGFRTQIFSDELTHKNPVTIASLVERFEHVLVKGQMSYWAVGEICDIVDQLKNLGDSDD